VPGNRQGLRQRVRGESEHHAAGYQRAGALNPERAPLGKMKNLITTGFWACLLLVGCGNPKQEEGSPQVAEARPVKASTYALNDCGECRWDSDHNSDRLTVTGDGLTIEWDGSKDKEGEPPPSWIPASTRLFLHSGNFRLDFRIDEMAGRQIGVGFMLQLTDGVNLGVDWGFFGYLGASSTAWAYDPSTGDIVTATGSVQGGLPKFSDGRSGVVQLHINVPRNEAGTARFIVDGTQSKAIPLPVGAVVLPAACFLRTGQRVTLTNFDRVSTDEGAQPDARETTSGPAPSAATEASQR